LAEYDEICQHFVVDNELWETLKNADPEKICHNGEIMFSRDEKVYQVPVLDEIYTVSPEEQKIISR